jgi:hypothetical protein
MTTGVSICICGKAEICDRTCAGALAQQAVCAEKGHLTAEAIHERAWGSPPATPLATQGYCYRCGDQGEAA